jgi:hypothetical protein
LELQKWNGRRKREDEGFGSQQAADPDERSRRARHDRGTVGDPVPGVVTPGAEDRHDRTKQVRDQKRREPGRDEL